MSKKSLLLVLGMFVGLMNLGLEECGEGRVWTVGTLSYNDQASIAVNLSKPMSETISEFETKHNFAVEKVVVEFQKPSFVIDSEITDTNPENLAIEPTESTNSEVTVNEVWPLDSENPEIETRQLTFSYRFEEIESTSCKYTAGEADQYELNTPLACVNLARPEITKAFASLLAETLKPEVTSGVKVYFILKNSGDRVEAKAKLTLDSLDCTGESFGTPTRFGEWDAEVVEFSYQDQTGKVQCSGLGVLEIENP